MRIKKPIRRVIFSPTTLLFSRVIFWLLGAMLLLHFLAFVIYAQYEKSAATEVNHELIAQHVVKIIQAVQSAAPGQQGTVVHAINIPNIRVALDHSAEFKPRLFSHDLWAILSALRKQDKQLQLSLKLNDSLWLNVTATVVASSWSFHALLMIYEVIVILVVIFLFWAINQFAGPLLDFAKAAESLGDDINSPPITLKYGPAIVKQTAQAINKMQKRIQDLVRDRTQMLAAMSHDLRTPITRLKLRAQFLEGNEQQAKILKDLAEMEAMITSILTFAREDNKKESKVKMDLNSLLAAISQDFIDLGHTVDYQVMTKRVLYNGRPLALRRAFSNVIDNAIKYGGVAEITLKLTKTKIVITVRDQGGGLPEVELEKVLAPFYRAEKSRSRDTGGTGLGLAITDDIIREHGGELTLVNRSDGHTGLVVTIVLPKKF